MFGLRMTPPLRNFYGKFIRFVGATRPSKNFVFRKRYCMFGQQGLCGSISGFSDKSLLSSIKNIVVTFCQHQNIYQLFEDNELKH